MTHAHGVTRKVAVEYHGIYVRVARNLIEDYISTPEGSHIAFGEVAPNGVESET